MQKALTYLSKNIFMLQNNNCFYKQEETLKLAQKY